MARALGASRLAAARQVISLLHGSRSFRESVVPQESGERPILLASIDDSMQKVLERIKAIGLPVTLCVPGGSTSISVVTVRAAEAHEHTSDPVEVQPETTVGMFISYVWVKGTVTFYVAELATEYELEFA
jgi:hypothetical protein